jgi:hypothetical protein
MSRKPTAEEMGKNLEDFAEDAKLLEEARGLGQRTKRDVAQSIEGSGHDEARAREMGRRFAEEFAKQEAEIQAAKADSAKGAEKNAESSARTSEAPERGPKRRLRWAWPLGIAAGFATALAAGWPTIEVWLEGAVASPGGGDAGPKEREARDLVLRASEDYAAGRYRECLEKLDRATALEPALASDPDVSELRAAARAKREATPAPPDGR